MGRVLVLNDPPTLPESSRTWNRAFSASPEQGPTLTP